MQNKKVIGIDLDDVLLDFNTAFIKYHNIVYKSDLNLRSKYNHAFDKFLGCDKEEAERRILEFYETDDHDRVLPIQGAPEAIQKLSQNNSLIIITARPERLREWVSLWLGKHYGDIFSGLYFTNQFHGTGIVKTKGETCKELGVDIFIDDHIKHIEEVALTGIKVLLFDMPWNQGELGFGITRVYSWNDILRELS